MAEPDSAKLDELKRLLRRLDKALPQSPAGNTQASPTQGRTNQRGSSATTLRTVVLASSVSMVVSLSVVALLFRDTLAGRFVVAQAPARADVQSASAPLQTDVSPPEGEQRPASIDKAAALQTDPALSQMEPLTTGVPSGEVTAEEAFPSGAASTAVVQEQDATPAPMGARAAVEAEPHPPSGPDMTEQSFKPSFAAVSPDVTSDAGAQNDPDGAPLVELDASQFLRRGLLMLTRGNAGAAQLLLERAADLGSGEAAFALASIYDGAPGAPRHGPEVRPNADLALRWYARAQELGVDEARKRLAEIKDGTTVPGR